MYFHNIKRSTTYINSALLSAFLLFFLSFNNSLAGEIYSTNFDTGTFNNQNGFRWLQGVKTSISSEKSKSGSYSLKFYFPAAASGKDSFSEQRFNLGGSYRDIWIKYDLYIPSNYYHRRDTGSNNNKAFTWLWAGEYQAAKQDGAKLGGHLWPTGSNGGSEFVAYARANVNGNYVLSKNWNCKACSNGKSSLAITNNDKGRWMTLVIHMKYASQANNDGVYEIWKTDWQGKTVKLVDIHDGPWYATMANSTVPGKGFDNGYLLGWANSGFNNDTFIYIDNLKFSTTPLVNNYSYIAAPKPPNLFN